MDEFLDNPAYLAGGGGVLALLGGYAAYAVRRKRKVEKFENSIITGGDLKANSVFGNTGGQSVDTGNSSFQSDFSQVSSAPSMPTRSTRLPKPMFTWLTGVTHRPRKF